MKAKDVKLVVLGVLLGVALTLSYSFLVRLDARVANIEQFLQAVTSGR
jgi:hypothetical protein